jgi:uracil-DNA glycosylase
MITSYFKPKTEPGQKRSSVRSVAKRSLEIDADADADAEDMRKYDAAPSPAVQMPSKRSKLVGTTEAQELLVHIKDDVWKEALSPQLASPAFARLAKFVQQERTSHTIYPASSDTFSMLNLCPLDSIKVVIVGQDPYHGPDQAHGLSFSVLKGQRIPPSLRNIYKELKEDPMITNFSEIPKHGHLIHWAQQGVLMLNAVLTVRKGDANSHKSKGWEETTDEILRAVDRHHNRQGVVFLLWGKPATAKAQAIIENTNHTIICTSHPSPLGATKTNVPFLGSRCFSRCNEALRANGYEPIDWNVD